jgi:hypothetical protein
MKDEIAKLLAERFLGKQNVSDWALNCLEKGFDSKSLRMLAPMSRFDSAAELNEFFQRALKELGWDNIGEESFLMRYAEILAQEIVENKIDPIKASRDIYQILRDLDYPTELHGWYEIDEMIWDYERFLRTAEQGYWFRPKEQLISEIKKVSEELIKSKEKV